MVPGSEAEDRRELTSPELERRDGRPPPIIGTASGGCFHVLTPIEAEVKVEDIAHHLAHIGRYTGACSVLWSVGSHCLEVSRRIERAGGSKLEQLQGLLHDASEAYLVDVPRPFKPDVSIAGASYYDVEERIMRCIFRALDVAWPMAPIVKETDDGMAYDEVANFFPPDSFIWRRYSITEKKTNLLPYSCYPGFTKNAFLRRFQELS